MSEEPIKNKEYRQWRTLLVYNLYRLLSIALFLGMYLLCYMSYSHPILFYTLLFFYGVFSLIFLYLCHTKKIGFELQVLFSGTIDVIAVSSMLGIIGNMQVGYGILLNITIAALSILVPGRLAIFFAALASSLLLCGNVVQFIVNGQQDLGIFFSSGIYGAGFFATALTALYLSHWVRQSEDLVRRRSDELAGMQRINEYIVDRLHSGVIYVDHDKRIKLVNAATRNFFSVSSDFSIHNLSQLSLLLASKFDNFLSRITHNERIAQTIIEEPYLRVHFFSTDVVNNSEVLIILDDMTYIAQQAQQLKLASLGRFSASIAHELRNPLGAVAHAVQLLGDEGALNKQDARLKQLIINNCDRMNGVIKNVLQLSRREQAKPEIINISSFLKQFKQNFCTMNTCNFVIQLPENGQTTVVFDASQLEQILIILCENAMQHGSAENGHATIIIVVKSASYKIILSVSDLGPGIPDEHKDTIFEPFFTTLRNGTGMGLFIAKDLCEINKARLNLVNSSQGSCFAITLNASDEQLL